MVPRLLFVLPSLGGGGAERVVTHLLRRFSQRGYGTSLLTFADADDYPGSLPLEVERISLGKRGTLDAARVLLRFVRILRVEPPTVLVSFLHYANILSVVARTLSARRFRLVISERNFPPSYLDEVRFRRLVTLLIRKTYRRADALVAVTNGIADCLARDFAVPRERISVVPNPVPVGKLRKLADSPMPSHQSPPFERYVLFVGRLSRQKRPDRLLRVFRRIADDIPGVGLVVAGTGELDGAVRELAVELGVEHRVAFLGFVANPYPLMRRAEVLCLTSDYEGFPNVLLEAMANGCPVVSTDCLTGPGELIEHGVSGFLVPPEDEDGFAGFLETILRDRELRRRMSRAAGSRADHFELDRLLPTFEVAILGSTVARA